MTNERQLSQHFLSKAAIAAFGVLILTSIHHVYGAYVYETPWRLHAALVSVITALIILSAQAIMRRRQGRVRTIASSVLVVLIAAVPILMIGLFEGLYNHVVRNVFYFGGLSAENMATLFPPPMYEMPDDAFFEITGVLQVVPAAFAAWYLYRALEQSPQSKKVEPGTKIETFTLETVNGESLTVPNGREMIHLQFRRFAGCPVCDLHLRTFVRRADEIVALGINEVVVFHSSREELLRHENDLPFSVIADPEKTLYKRFGVESSARALLDPRAWLPILRGVLNSAGEVIRGRQPLPPIGPDGGSLGLPADFLIAGDGRVLACKYGVHVNDHWSVDELFDSAVEIGNGRQDTVVVSSNLLNEPVVAYYDRQETAVAKDKRKVSTRRLDRPSTS